MANKLKSRRRKRTIQDELKHLKSFMAVKMPKATESGNFLNYGKLNDHPAVEVDLNRHGLHTGPIPDELRGYYALGLGIVGPTGCAFEIKSIKHLKRKEPFRRFADVVVTYATNLNGVESEEEAQFAKESGPNLETLGRLEEFMSFFDQSESVNRTDYDTRGLTRLSQWGEVVSEFDQLMYMIEKLPVLEEHGRVGSLIGTAIRWYSDRAYHLGLRVREAELSVFQNDTIQGKDVPRRAKKAGEVRGKQQEEEAKAWKPSFGSWLDEKVKSGDVGIWLAKKNKRKTIISIADYSREHWPEFPWSFSIGETVFRGVQKDRPAYHQLRRIISGFAKTNGPLKNFLRK